MANRSKISYTSLEVDNDPSECSTREAESGPFAAPKYITFKVFIILEICHLLMAALGYGVWSFCDIQSWQPEFEECKSITLS